MESGTQTRFDREGIQRWPGPRGDPRGERDRAAKLAEFARRHHQSLVRFFTQRLGSREEARDLVQGAYLKALTADHPEGIRDVEGYVWRRALKLATDWGRHRAVQARGAACLLAYEQLPHLRGQPNVLRVARQCGLHRHAIERNPFARRNDALRSITSALMLGRACGPDFDSDYRRSWRRVNPRREFTIELTWSGFLRSEIRPYGVPVQLF